MLIEVRTKSANFRLLRNVNIPDNIIFAWTLSPREIIREFEHGTPGLDERLRDIKAACELGCKIRISIEPVMQIRNFENIYNSFIKEIFNTVNGENIKDINLGTFRMSDEYLKKIKRADPYSGIFAYPMENANGVVTYKDHQHMTIYLRRCLENDIDSKKIFSRAEF